MLSSQKSAELFNCLVDTVENKLGPGKLVICNTYYTSHPPEVKRKMNNFMLTLIVMYSVYYRETRSITVRVFRNVLLCILYLCVIKIMREDEQSKKPEEPELSQGAEATPVKV